MQSIRVSRSSLILSEKTSLLDLTYRSLELGWAWTWDIGLVRIKGVQIIIGVQASIGSVISGIIKGFIVIPKTGTK